MRCDPIFVLSAPRSGSTLLRVMLAGHPRLFSPPEMHLLSYKTMKEREAALGPCPWGSCPQSHDCDRRHGLQRAIMELKQIDDAESRRMIDAMVERDEPIERVYETLGDLAAPRRLVDKSPSYPEHMETLHRARKLFPRASYIYLYRHPYAVIHSITRIEAQSPAKAESIWARRNRNIQSFLTETDPARQAFVAYETLVRDPETVMRRLCGFLDIEFDSDTLKPYEGNRMTDGVRPESLLPGDWNFYNHQGIEPRLADVWRGLGPPLPLGDDAQRISGALGYEVPVAVPGPAQ